MEFFIVPFIVAQIHTSAPIAKGMVVDEIRHAESVRQIMDASIIQIQHALSAEDAADLGIPAVDEAREKQFRLITDKHRVRLETQYMTNANKLETPYIVSFDGTTMFRWHANSDRILVDGTFDLRTGDSGFAAFNQTIGFRFPGGSGALGRLADSLADESRWSLQSLGNNVHRVAWTIGTYDNEVEYEIDIRLDPVFHIIRFSSEFELSDPEHVDRMIRREIINADWEWFDALYLPTRATSTLSVPPGTGYGNENAIQSTTEYKRLSSSDQLPGPRSRIFQPPFEPGIWVYDRRIRCGFQLGGHQLNFDGTGYEGDLPIWITKWSDPLFDLRKINFEPLPNQPETAHAEHVESSPWRNPVVSALVAGLAAFSVISGFRILGTSRRRIRRTTITH